MVACCRVGGTACSTACMGAFEGGHHYLYYLHHSLVSDKNREGTHPCPSTENWIKGLLSMSPPIRKRCSFLHSQSLPSGRVHNPLILLQQRADTPKPYSQKTSQSNHTRTTALSNSMKLSHARGATQDGRVRLERSDRCGPLEKGMANHFSILALRTP